MPEFYIKQFCYTNDKGEPCSLYSTYKTKEEAEKSLAYDLYCELTGKLNIASTEMAEIVYRDGINLPTMNLLIGMWNATHPKKKQINIKYRIDKRNIEF
jgi:hypothetical protein